MKDGSKLKSIRNKNLMSTKQEQELKDEKKMDAAAEEEIKRAVEEESDLNDTDRLLEDQQKRINELEEELELVKETQLRKAAEMENFKKRLQRERDQVFQSSREASLEVFLPVFDDLLRTLDAMEEGGAHSSYIDGIKLVAAKFEDVLKRFNVEKIDESGVPFDVNLHDALMRQKPEDDSIESGTVLQVFENGYRIGDKTLRHAKVIVSE
jgi:molecular chaperone GrpE